MIVQDAGDFAELQQGGVDNLDSIDFYAAITVSVLTLYGLNNTLVDGANKFVVKV